MIFRFLHRDIEGRMLSSILKFHFEVKDMGSPFHECTALWANFKENPLFFGLKNTMSGVHSCIASILNFSASKLRGGKISVKAFRGGGAKFQCTAFEGGKF